MITQTTTVCIRCGKPRVIMSELTEMIGTSKVKTVITECADSECQKLVDAMFARESVQRRNTAREKEARENLRKAASKRNKNSEIKI